MVLYRNTTTSPMRIGEAVVRPNLTIELDVANVPAGLSPVETAKPAAKKPAAKKAVKKSTKNVASEE